jgi:hypothetical protein
MPVLGTFRGKMMYPACMFGSMLFDPIAHAEIPSRCYDIDMNSKTTTATSVK